MPQTPGPWHASRCYFTGQLHHIEVNAESEGIAVCQSEANAHLIAAAPDLLRACELALAHVPRSDDAPDGGIHGLMERAIAKAKGE